MGVQTVKKGSFDFTPNKLTPFIGFDRVGYVSVFNENCNYVYSDSSQQGDWLKLGGVAFSLFPWQKHENSTIIGFRHNPDSGLMELLDYWHIDGVTDRGIGREPIAAVHFKEKFVWWVRANQSKKQVSINIRTKDGTVSKIRDFSKLSTIVAWPIGGYAGGDIKAVQEMSFVEDRVDRWNQDGPVVQFTNWM